MTQRYGLENFEENSGNNSLMLLQPGESKLVRFLQEASKMALLKRHWFKGEGYINCLGKGCPLCQVASAEWGAPIAIARDYFMVVLIDRSDNKVKVFEGGKTVKDKLLNFSKDNGLTQVDFKIRRSEAKNGKDIYDLTPIIKKPKPLSEDEKERISEIDLNWALKRGEKTREEILDLIGGGESISS